MRAVLCKAFGEPGSLVVEEVAAPPLRPGSARVAVHAAGVNFGDTLMVAGTYQEKPPFPFTPGFEIGGEVIEVASDVTGLKPGDRVMGTLPHGGYADEAVVAAADLTPIPAAMDYAVAAGFPVAYGTSHGALDWRARLHPGETLLVHGAAGGVGITAVEIGKAMGATVIATAGGAAKLAIAERHGADHLIDYSHEDIRACVKKLTD
jgi:NADPH:quinone reductase